MKTKDIKSGQILDTDKMRDSVAEVFQMQQELLERCIKYDIPILSIVMGGKDNDYVFQYLVKTEENFKVSSDPLAVQRFKNLIGVLNGLIQQASCGKLCIVENPNYESPKSSLDS